MRCHIDDREFQSETGTDKSILAVRPEHGHSWAIGQFDAPRLLHSRGIDYRYGVLTAHRHPQLTAILCEERFMRRAADINHALDFIRFRVDQRYRIRSYRHHRQHLAIW